MAGICVHDNEPLGFQRIQGVSQLVNELASQKGLCSMELVVARILISVLHVIYFTACTHQPKEKMCTEKIQYTGCFTTLGHNYRR